MLPLAGHQSDEHADIDDDDDEPLDINSMSNVEQLIDEITKEKKPRQKKYLKTKKTPSHHVIDNHPPRRLGPNTPQGLYPMIGIENEEQRRLANIADQISGVTQKLAMDNGRYNMGIDSQLDAISNPTAFKQVKEQTLNDIMNQDSHRHLLQTRP